MKRQILRFTTGVVLSFLCMALLQIPAYAAGTTIKAADGNGTMPHDETYDGPQIVKIRLLEEGDFLEIYWDRYVDEEEAVNPANFVLKNGSQEIALDGNTADSWGWTNTLYFDKNNKAVAATDANSMERLDKDLHMSSIYFHPDDLAKITNLDKSGFVLEVKGTAIKDANGKSAKTAVYTGIPQVSYYKQSVTSKTGIVIKSDESVAYSSLELAAQQVDAQLAKTETGVAKTMAEYGCSLAVYSPHQNVYLIPEHRYGFNPLMYDVEGYGGNEWNNCVSSIAERNILRTRNNTEDWYLNTWYPNENILIHEFGHCVKSIGLEKNPDSSYIEEFRSAYENAKAKGLWPNTYAISNEDEFFATVCAVWFNVMDEAPDWSDGVRSPINTRLELKNYDPTTYAFFEKILPSDKVLPAPWDEAAPDKYHYGPVVDPDPVDPDPVDPDPVDPDPVDPDPVDPDPVDPDPVDPDPVDPDPVDPDPVDPDPVDPDPVDPDPEKIVQSISVTSPEKTKYLLDEELVTEGMEVAVCYTDGTKETVSDGYEVSGYDSQKIGKQTITVTYEEKKAEFTVEILGLPFVDVTPGEECAWYYKEVYKNYHAGIMTGTDKEHFSPFDNLARAQFAVILHRMNGEPEVAYTGRFPDVAAKVWYTDAILWASSIKVVNGYSHNGLFGPSDNITREQMAVMMYRYAEYLEKDTKTRADYGKFTDSASVGVFAEDAMSWAVGTGIITGKDNGTRLDPQGNASRAECAIIIQRFLEKL